MSGPSSNVDTVARNGECERDGQSRQRRGEVRERDLGGGQAWSRREEDGGNRGDGAIWRDVDVRFR